MQTFMPGTSYRVNQSSTLSGVCTLQTFYTQNWPFGGLGSTQPAIPATNNRNQKTILPYPQPSSITTTVTIAKIATPYTKPCTP